MNKEYLNHVKYVKESLNIWFSHVEQLHNGIQMFSKENDLDRKNTDFAKWYYDEGQIFSSFDTFRTLEPFYNEMYDVYIDYTELRNKPVKKGLFTNHAEKRKNELDELFVALRKNARKLIKSVEIFEENIKSSPLFGEESNIPSEEKIISENPSNPENIAYQNDDLPILEEPKEVTNTDSKLVSNEESIINEQTTSNATGDSKASGLVADKNSTPKSSDDPSFDFEKRLQEEVQKIKEQLKQELLEAKKEKENLQKSKPAQLVDNKEVDSNHIDSEKPSHPKTKSTKPTPDIDLDEEIRRILS